MSVKHSLLALLADGPRYGARLRAEFEDRTGGTWPLNVGQVYTTLGRLERDGLVAEDGGPDDEGRIGYRITDLGRDELARWWAEPVDREVTPRNELAIKLALAVTVPGVDVESIVDAQRLATMGQLRALTRTKARLSARADGADVAGAGDGAGDLARLLVVDNLIYAAESEARWLDHVEARVLRRH